MSGSTSVGAVLEAEGPVWLDGTIAPAEDASVRMTDPAVQAGLGVFETIAVRNGVPVELSEHLRRLENGAAVLSVPLPERVALERGARAIAASVVGGYGWLKVSALRSERCIVFGGRMDPLDEGRSVSAVLLRWRQNPHDAIAGLKTLNYANHILGLEEARRRGADEGIWRNTRGHLAECCTSSLFLVHRRTIYTPAISDGILPGITRGTVLHAARNLGIRVHEGKIRVRRLEQADEAFLSSSLRAIRPLIRVDARPVGDGEPGPVTRAVAAEVERLREPESGGTPDVRRNPVSP